MHILYKKRFLKHYKKLPEKVQIKADESVRKFMKNPTDKDLRNHPLSGKFESCRSIDVTGDYRIIFHEIGEGYYELIELIDIGTHSQLY